MVLVLNLRSYSVKRVILILFLFLLFGLASLLVLVSITSSKEHVPRGIEVNGIPFGGLNRGEAEEKLLEISCLMVSWPKDPFYEGGYLKEGKDGRFIAVNKTLEKIFNSPENSHISPVYFNVPSFYDSDNFNQIRYGKGTDKEIHFLTGEELKELKNISNKLYDKIIYPGEVFSLNDFWQGNINKDLLFSSNISQLLARTLYMTAKKANLKIVEAWILNQPKIGSLSMENLEFQPGKDLKFRNSTNTPLVIKGELDSEGLKLWFLGS